jgi:pimeloyl-ACP methyl ester carboxylesterase
MSTSSTATGSQIRLHDGRNIGYAEYGDPAGKPVFFFHGWPGSRLFLRSLHSQTASLKIRLIACERPGFGLSDFKPQRKLMDWADDVAEVADQLKISRFAVAGHSGGGPYVAACAYKIPSRLIAAALISSFAPLDVPNATKGMMLSNQIMFNLARHIPFAHRMFIKLLISGGAERFLQGMLSSLPKVDKAILASLKKGADDIAEAFRSGAQGPAWDQFILANFWGFDLTHISMDVYLWQGDQDVMVPLPMGQYLAKTLPKCHATFCSGEGHMLIFSRWSEILTKLAIE